LWSMLKIAILQWQTWATLNTEKTSHSISNTNGTFLIERAVYQQLCTFKPTLTTAMSTIIQYNNATTLSHMHTATVDETKYSCPYTELLMWENKRYSTTLSSHPQEHLMCCAGPTCGLHIPDPSDKRNMGKVT
jgi:hypothetical protein